MEVTDELAKAIQQEMLKRCKLYIPKEGHRWANQPKNNLEYHILVYESALCELSAIKWVVQRYPGDSKLLADICKWYYEEYYLPDLQKRLGGKEALNAYLALPVLEFP